MGIRIVDKSDDFIKKVGKGLDLAFSAMSADIERLSKMQVPVSKGGGHLKASGHTQKLGILKYRVIYNKVYAMYQHEGGDGKRTVRNYTYPGKKKHYLIDPARLTTSKYLQYFKRYAQ